MQKGAPAPAARWRKLLSISIGKVWSTVPLGYSISGICFVLLLVNVQYVVITISFNIIEKKPLSIAKEAKVKK